MLNATKGGQDGITLSGLLPDFFPGFSEVRARVKARGAVQANRAIWAPAKLLLFVFCAAFSASAEPQSQPLSRIDPAAAQRITDAKTEIRRSDQYRQAAENLQRVRTEIRGQTPTVVPQQPSPSGESHAPTTEQLLSMLRRRPVIVDHAMRRKELEREEARLRAALRRAKEENAYPKFLIRHIRGNDKQTLPLPSREEVADRRRTVESARFKALRKTRIVRPILPGALPEAKMVDCRSETKRTELRDVGKGGEEVFVDVLFARKEQLPFNTETSLGTKVTIYRWERGERNPAALIGASFGVECLPYRIRVTSAAAYRYKGDDALRNYDSEDSGK